MNEKRYEVRATGGGLYTVVDTVKSEKTMIPNTSKEKAELDCEAFNRREETKKAARQKI